MKDILVIPEKYQKLERENILALLEPMRNLPKEEAAIVCCKGDYAVGTIKKIYFVTKESKKRKALVDTEKLVGLISDKDFDSFIFVHNHPDEPYTPLPSPPDIDFTKYMQQLCDDHNVDVIDSVILAKNSEFFFDDMDLIINPSFDQINKHLLLKQALFRFLSIFFPKFKKYCFF